MAKRSKKAYMCGTDWLHELDSDSPHSVSVFNTKKALKKKQPCWKECGIVEVEIKYKKCVLKSIW